MSWNEPGGDKNDPWSGKKDQKGPPDFDEAIRTLQEKLSNLFGGGKGGSGGDGDNNNEPNAFNSENVIKNIGYIVGGLVLVWLASGIYTVDEGYQGIETRFGQYIGTTNSGLNWHMPFPIETVEKVNVKDQRSVEIGYRSSGTGQAQGSIPVPKEALMLTRDENYIDVKLAVQYQVKDAKDFLFNLADPKATLIQVTETALRGVVGGNDMDFILTEGRAEIVAQAKKEIQDTLDRYKSGIQISTVNLQDAKPPEQVQSAFDDAVKAREDQQRFINEAEAYSNDVIPKARGLAARKIQEAQGYKEQVIAQAQGETNRFTKLLAEYKKSPDITRKRLYIEAMETVLSETSSVVVDVKGGNNMMYLPLDKMVNNRHAGAAANEEHAAAVAASIDRPSNLPATSEAEHGHNFERPSSRGRERDGRGR